jgi:hypothetical protein
LNLFCLRREGKKGRGREAERERDKSRVRERKGDRRETEGDKEIETKK